MGDFPAALPHGPITAVADRVHQVRGRFPFGPGMVIGRTMTIVVGPDGLIVMNPVRLTESGFAELDELGPVTHLLKLSDSHDRDEAYFASRYSPRVWTIPGAKLKGLTSSATLGPDGPVPGATVVDFGRTGGWREAAYFLPYGNGTLVTCDVVQNHVDKEGATFLASIMTSMMGFKGGVIVPKMWRKYHRVSGNQVRETLSGLEKLTFANLVTGHGPAVVGGADVRVREAIAKASA
jgi:hypothetical protein